MSPSEGGRIRSNTARSRKRFKVTIQDFNELQGVLLVAIEEVRSGKLEPGQPTAVATLARAIQGLSPIANFDDQLNAMQTEINALQTAQVA